jgi:hypothetical protein
LESSPPKTLWGKYEESCVYDMLLKLLKTQWENKEKMVQHIMVRYAVKTPSKPSGKIRRK